MSELTREYKISYDKFDNKTLLRIRNTKLNTPNLFGRSKSTGNIDLNLDILNYCVVDYVKSLSQYEAKEGNDNLDLIVSVAYYADKKYNVELVRYGKVKSFVESIIESDGLVIGETIKTAIIDVLDADIPCNLISNIEFEINDVENRLCKSITDYYLNEESITCRFS